MVISNKVLSIFSADKGEYNEEIKQYQKAIKDYSDAIKNKIESNWSDNCRYFMKRGILYEKLRQFNAT